MTTQATSKPNRRRVTVTMTLNAELVRQLDEHAHDEMVTRSRLWERVATDWVSWQLMKEAAS